MEEVNLRRNSVRILYEILRLSREGVSRAQAVRQTNLNFVLMGKYVDFLTRHEYVKRDSQLKPSRLTLTSRGRHLLALLSELEIEMTTFMPLQAESMLATRHESKVFSGQNGSQERDSSTPDSSLRITQTLSKETFAELESIASRKGISVQELLRAVVIPDWLNNQ